MSTLPTPPRIPLRWLLLVGLPALGVLLWWKLPPRTDDPSRGQPGATWISTNTSARLGIGDDPRWADPQYDDSAWPEVDLNELPQSREIYWLRIRMTIAPNDTPKFARLANSVTGIRHAVGERIRRFGVNALAVESASAQELFWQGQPIGRAGVPGATVAVEEPGVHRSFFPLPTGQTGPGNYVLAVRLSQQRALHWSKYFTYNVWAGRFDDMVTRVWIYALGGMGLIGIGLIGAAFCFVAWWLVERRAGFLAFAGCCFGFAALGFFPVAREIGWVNYPGYQALLFASGVLNLVVGVLLVLSAVRFLELPRPRWWLLLAVPPVVLAPFFHVYFFLRGNWSMHWYLAATLFVAVAGWSLRRRGSGWVAAAVAVPWGLELTGYMQLARNFGDLDYGVLVLLFGVGLFRSIGFSLRSEQLRTRQSQLSSARLETELLKRNIQPHFLLNSLGSIAQFVEENPAIASRMIDALADEFRLVSKLSQRQLVTLGEEIDLCEAHLRVMSLRREARYRLEVEAPDRTAPIPPALIHTLVENAITHGGPSHTGERVVRLTETRSADGSRVIELNSPMTAHTDVRDATSDRPDGTGLRYVKARLEESFPGRWTFAAAPVADGWRVRIVLAPASAFSGGHLMRLLLVEDEPPIARRIEKMTRELLGERLAKLQVVETLLEAEHFLAGDCIDLLLLDLNLHGSSGFALLEQAVAGSFHTVVVSANTDQALRAFEYGVLDFVPKPVTIDRFRLALARVNDVRTRSEFAARTLAVLKHGRVVLVAVDDVSYVKGAGPYSELVLANGKRELHGKSIEKLLALLPPHFERIHKSYIVDMRRVKTFHVGEGSHYEAELNNGECIPVGRERWKEIRTRLK